MPPYKPHAHLHTLPCAKPHPTPLQEPKACSIVLRGASKDVLNEVILRCTCFAGCYMRCALRCPTLCTRVHSRAQ